MLNLTNDERKVIIFLATIFLLGLGVNFLVKQLTPTKNLANFSDKLGKVNLNTADKKLLMSISGVGEKLSQRIIEFRNNQGGFSNVEELKGLKGITETKFNKMKDYLITE
ncbi:MAG: helix-hairpin-helix domain-containing protein, partial [Candidatus Omnitrophota bacterium]|jgi:competence protein ComEA